MNCPIDVAIQPKARTMPPFVAQPPAELPPATHQFVCSEIWGGNRRVDSLIALPGLRGRIVSMPATGGRGGDVHYLSACDSGVLARICLADVAGHGDAVAAVGSEIHHLLRKFVNQSDQREFLRTLNRRLASGDLGAMTTVAALSYYPTSRSLSVSYAGHPPALLCRRGSSDWQRVPPDDYGDEPNQASGNTREDKHRNIDIHGHASRQATLRDMPLGVDSNTRFSRWRVRLAPGDRIVVFTDGVLEAPAAGPAVRREFFGEARLVDVCRRNTGLSPAELVDAILAELAAFTGNPALPHDDVTLLAVDVVPAEGGPLLWKALRNRVLRPLFGLPAAEAR